MAKLPGQKNAKAWKLLELALRTGPKVSFRTHIRLFNFQAFGAANKRMHGRIGGPKWSDPNGLT
jgi:hypothetical protein